MTTNKISKWEKLSELPKELSHNIKTDLRTKFADLLAEWIEARLDVVLVWDNESAKAYAEFKQRIAKVLWVEVVIHHLHEWVPEDEVRKKIIKLNNDQKVHGILIESPVSEGIDYDKLMNLIHPSKDVDGLTETNLWKILSMKGEAEGKECNLVKSDWIVPATPQACITILQELIKRGVVEKIEWLEIVMVWYGKTVGGTLAPILSKMWATVTVCNRHTKDLEEKFQKADVVITATGVRGLIKPEMVNKNTVIIDAWISVDEWGKIFWDVSKDASEIAKYVSSVPWGVGTVTTAIIFKNLLKWIMMQKEEDFFELSLDDSISRARWPNMPWWWWIATLSAINAISMISMVYFLTKGIEKTEYEPQVDEIISKLKELYKADIQSFNAYLRALRLPKDWEKEKEFRSQEIQEALKKCSLVPIEVAKICLEIINIWKECYKVGNKNVLTDVRVGHYLAVASAMSALEPLEMNTKSIKDKDFVKKVMDQKKEIIEEIAKFLKELTSSQSNIAQELHSIMQELDSHNDSNVWEILIKMLENFNALHTQVSKEFSSSASRWIIATTNFIDSVSVTAINWIDNILKIYIAWIVRLTNLLGKK